MTSPQTVEVTLTLDAELLEEVGAPEDLSDFVNAALRAVHSLRENPPAERPVSATTPAAPDLQTQLVEAAAQRAADEAAEAAETAKWDEYLS